MAFNAKNLHYEKQEPAFLRRLRGQYSGEDSSPRPNQQRPRRLKGSGGDDEEDAPTYVDESGDVIGKEDYERLVRGEEVQEKDDRAGEANVIGDEKTETGNGEVKLEEEVEKITEQKFAGIGGGHKKRKVVKVVGADEEENGDEVSKKGVLDGKEAKGMKKAQEPTYTDMSKSKPAKKKRIKLSFDEDE